MSDYSELVWRAQQTFIQEVCFVRDALTAPHVLYKPSLYQDGDQWCALFGGCLADGVAGFGDTPEKAMEAFDNAWRTQTANAALLRAKDGDVDA